MADTLITAAIAATNGQRQTPWGPYWANPTDAVAIYVDDGNDLAAMFTGDGGATWGNFAQAEGGNAVGVACYFEPETPGITGDVVHVTWMDIGTNDFRYASVDISTQTWSAVTSIIGGATGGTRNLLRTAVTETRDGNLLMTYVDQTAGISGCERSVDGGASWAARADPYEANVADFILLFPANTADPADAAALFWDRSANAISVKMYDHSANTWTETAILVGMTEDSNYQGWDGATLHSDGLIYAGAWSAINNPAADLRTFTINPNSIAAPTIDTSTANVVTNQDASGGCAILINQQNDDIYIAYLKGGAWLTSVIPVYHLSGDQMASWGVEQAYGESADDHRRIHAGRTVGDNGGFFQPVFYDDDDVAIYVNLPNDVAIAAAAALTIALTGTVIGATEANIVAGGRTIILTLTGDTWVAAGAAFNAIRQNIIDGMTSAGGGALGWNNEVRDKEVVGAVVRTNATVATITLTAAAAYNISANETITVTVPGGALVGGVGAVAAPTFTITFTPVPPTRVITTADALSGRFGPVVQAFTFEHRDRKNLLVQELTGVVEVGGAVDLDNDRPTVRTCRLTMNQTAIDDLATAFDPATDHVAIFMDILVNSVFESFQLGLFRLDVVDREDSDQGTFLRIEGADVAIHLLEDFLTGPLTVASGMNYITAIETQLDAVGLSHALPAVAAVLPADRTWKPGTARWEVVRDLAFALNRFPPWAQGDGVFTTRERISPSDEAADVAYSNATEPRLLIAPTIRRENRARFPNRAVVLIDHPDRVPSFELRQNNDPTSPISIAATGKTTEAEEFAGGIVLDTTVAGEIAAYELRESAAKALLRDIGTVLDPRRGAHEFYDLDITGIEANTLWRVDSWRFPLSIGAEMSHVVGRAQAVNITEP